MKRRQLLQGVLATAPLLAAPRLLRAASAELLVGTNVGGPPFAFKTGDGYAGFDIELWTEIAKGLGRTWRLQPMEFSALIPALQTRNLDVVISDLFVKPERKKVIDFSDPYFESGLVAVTRVGNGAINTPADLAGKTIGTETGTIAVDYIKHKIEGATLAQLPSINDALLALQAGRTDAVIYDTPILMYYANTTGKGKVKVIEPTLAKQEVAIGFPKGSPLVAEVNAQLAAMRADGRYEALNKKWFGA